MSNDGSPRDPAHTDNNGRRPSLFCKKALPAAVVATLFSASIIFASSSSAQTADTSSASSQSVEHLERGLTEFEQSTDVAVETVDNLLMFPMLSPPASCDNQFICPAQSLSLACHKDHITSLPILVSQLHCGGSSICVVSVWSPETL